MAGGDDLREQIANLRVDHATLGQRVSGIENQIGGLRNDLEQKHSQNRISIHDLRDLMQDSTDELHKLAISMTSFISAAKASGGIKAKIFNNLWMVIGGGLVALVAELIHRGSK